MIRFLHTPCLLAAFAASSCVQEAPRSSAGAPPPAVTNRIPTPPEVVNNLGLSFQAAERGRLKQWRTISGELVVPEHRRWTVRAPASGRLRSVAPQWTTLERGDLLATLSSPELLAARRALAMAIAVAEDAAVAAEATRERLEESVVHLGEAERFEEACRARLAELLELQRSSNPLVASELMSARGVVADASRTRLDAAITRDGLRSQLASNRRAVREAELKAAEERAHLRLLTDVADAESPVVDAAASEVPAVELLVLSPGSGVVVELLASPGVMVREGDPLARVAATDLLQFRGYLPEGDAGSIAPDAPVTLEYTSEHLGATETTLALNLPVALDRTRMLVVTAAVPNDAGLLASGMSARAHVQVGESANDEVLVPAESVVQDGLEAIVFKRDGSNPDVVVRTPVELGARSPARIEILAGLLPGDLVVVDGVHQLKQTGLGKAPEGGHFHADGTWHAEHD
ncbi:MAG: efflux RND transporter periplasmic adaptor subunit [Planctomycetota bacterium]